MLQSLYRLWKLCVCVFFFGRHASEIIDSVVIYGKIRGLPSLEACAHFCAVAVDTLCHSYNFFFLSSVKSNLEFYYVLQLGIRVAHMKS